MLLFSVATSAMSHPRRELLKEFLTDIGNYTKSVLPTLGSAQRIECLIDTENYTSWDQCQYTGGSTKRMGKLS
jgi:hypothetical protein